MADNPSYNAPSVTAAADTIVYTTRYETNTTTGVVKMITEALNVTAGSVSYIDPDSGAAYAPTGTVANQPIRVQLGTQTLADVEIGNVAGATNLTLPAGANHAEVHVYNADGLVYTLDGTDPAGTAGAPTSGFRVNSGGTFELESADEITNMAFFGLQSAAGAGDGIYAEYFNFGDSWGGVTD